MSSTIFTGAAPLGRVIPFPARSAPGADAPTGSIRRFQVFIGAFERAMDFCAVVAAVWVARWVSSAWPGIGGRHYSSHVVAVAASSLGVLTVLLLETHGDYRPCLSLLAVRETERLLRVTVLGILLGLPLVVTATQVVPRTLIALAAVLVPLTLAVEKWQVQMMIWAARRRAALMRKALIVGTGPLGRRMFSALAHSPKLGIDPVAFVQASGTIDEPVIHESWYRRERQAPVLAGPVTSRMLRQSAASVLILADPEMTPEESEQIRREAEAEGVSAYIIPGPFADDDTVTEYVELDGVMMARQVQRTERLWYETSKRIVDAGVSVLSIVLLAPLMAAAGLAVKLTSPGPVIFRQKRVGRNGRLFNLYKFRTMFVESPRYACSPVSGKDPRITRVGRFLRHTCIDELPQLFNVLRGEMSLVGPRPEMPFIVKQYEAIHRQRLAVKPGITGLWQLSADRMSPIHQNISYDIYYVRNRSLWMDIAILLHTVVFAFRGV